MFSLIRWGVTDLAMTITFLWMWNLRRICQENKPKMHCSSLLFHLCLIVISLEHAAVICEFSPNVAPRHSRYPVLLVSIVNTPLMVLWPCGPHKVGETQTRGQKPSHLSWSLLVFISDSLDLRFLQQCGVIRRSPLKHKDRLTWLMNLQSPVW